MTDIIKVLVTDDEDGMRLGVQRALRNMTATFNDLDAQVSYKIHMASTGEEALEKLEQDDFELMLLDYKLPGMNGLEVLSKAKEKDDEMHVIMMTAYASLDTAVTATKKGAFDFLAKPFTPEELRATVRKATRNLILNHQARKLADEKRKVRFEFISVLSHELKAPIGAVEGYLDLIRTGNVKDEETLQRIVNRSMVRLGGMRKLIFDILDLTRIESGSKQRHIAPFSMEDVARNAIELMDVQAKSRGIQMELSVFGDSMLNGDKGELEIVLNNLVSNAVKYNEDNGRVDVTLSCDDTRIVLTVADTGIGMTQEETNRLFGEFVRIKNAKTRQIEGSGLGLSTVKKIVQLYNGEVKVQSEPDVGTTFTVRMNKNWENS